MGASTGLAGADLFGTMIEYHRNDVGAALRDWAERLKPLVANIQKMGVERRFFFTPGTQMQIATRPVAARVIQLPLAGPVLNRMAARQRNKQQSDSFAVSSAA